MNCRRFTSAAGPILTLALLLTACTGSAAPTPLVIFAAASLSAAFDDIGAAFEAGHPGVQVQFNFGGSQNLRTQLEQGARADLLAAASQEEMARVSAAGLIEAGTVRAIAFNRLVIIAPQGNPARLANVSDLARPGLKLVLAAPEVPAGQYARLLIRQLAELYGADFETRTLANVVSNEDNVRQATAKVQLGEADAGIVYASDAVATPDLHVIPLPVGVGVTASYQAAVLAQAAQPALAAEFMQAVLTPAGQATLARWGFTTASAVNEP